ncbi:ferredoxin [Nocardioides sp. NPDC101246]|uniref:ferredoxin n=1 Tax=Nocardioides sp. NPDC101246 TaxID=3364336 RepID=UPI003815C9A0
MKFTVDLHQCQNLGQCTVSAPEVFSFSESGELGFRSEAAGEYVSADLSDAALDEVSTAVDMCPMQAISLQG